MITTQMQEGLGRGWSLNNLRILLAPRSNENRLDHGLYHRCNDLLYQLKGRYQERHLGCDVAWYRRLLTNEILPLVYAFMRGDAGPGKYDHALRHEAKQDFKEIWATYLPIIMQDMPVNRETLQTADRLIRRLSEQTSRERRETASLQAAVDVELVSRWFKINAHPLPAPLTKVARTLKVRCAAVRDDSARLRDTVRDMERQALLRLLSGEAVKPDVNCYSRADILWRHACGVPNVLSGDTLRTGHASLPTPVSSILHLTEMLNGHQNFRLIDIGAGWGNAIFLIHLLTGRACAGVEHNQAAIAAHRTVRRVLDIPEDQCRITQQPLDLVTDCDASSAFILTNPFDIETHFQTVAMMKPGALIFTWGESTRYLLTHPRCSAIETPKFPNGEKTFGCFRRI